MKRNRKNVSLKPGAARYSSNKGSNPMIAAKTKIKKEARKTARSAYRASRSKVKSVSRGPKKKVSDNGEISRRSTATSRVKGTPLSPDELNKIDAYWRAANYLSVGQIYLYDNPLLKKPLKKEHIKP